MISVLLARFPIGSIVKMFSDLLVRTRSSTISMDVGFKVIIIFFDILEVPSNSLFDQ